MAIFFNFQHTKRNWNLEQGLLSHNTGKGKTAQYQFHSPETPLGVFQIVSINVLSHYSRDYGTYWAHKYASSLFVYK
jgi:hypothetical protein